MSRAYDLLASLVPKLAAITVANGYSCDAGARVLLGPVPTAPGQTLPIIRLHEQQCEPVSSMPYRNQAKVKTTFIAEIIGEQPDAASMMATAHGYLSDLKRALFGQPDGRSMGGLAMEIGFEGHRIAPPEDGSDLVVAQVLGSYTFVEHFDAP